MIKLKHNYSILEGKNLRSAFGDLGKDFFYLENQGFSSSFNFIEIEDVRRFS